MGPPATKENRKGQTRRYNYRRKAIITIISIVLTSATVFVVVCQLRTRSPSGNKPPSFDDNNNNNNNNNNKARKLILDQPIRSIDYGIRSTTPVVMIRTSLDEELHHRLLEEHLYSCSEEELNHIPELDNRVKPPVYVYEGYYHSLPTSNSVYSRNPNPLIGKDFHKPPAPSFTRAFYEAFRVVNGEIFDRLKRNLLRASEFFNDDNATNNTILMEEDACYVLAKWIEKGYHFGDLSIQIHYGKGNEGKLTSGVAWHTDAENSLLHLAVTLRGSRVLHSRRTRRTTTTTVRDANSTLLRRPKGQEQSTTKEEEVLERQEPGNVYLSSSTLMRHAPRFFDTDYSNRVIAIHARILYTSAEVDHFRRVRTKDSWSKLTNVLASTLAVADLQMPSLAQVESQLTMLS